MSNETERSIARSREVKIRNHGSCRGNVEGRLKCGPYDPYAAKSYRSRDSLDRRVLSLEWVAALSHGCRRFHNHGGNRLLEETRTVDGCKESCYYQEYSRHFLAVPREVHSRMVTRQFWILD